MPNRRTASPVFFSWFRTRRLLAPSRFVWLRTKEMLAVSKLETIDAFPIACVAWRFCEEQSPRGFSALARPYLLCALNQNRHVTQATFPKIQAWTYNGYSRLQQRQRRMKSEFTVSIVIIPTRLLCQMQANSSGAQLLSTTSKFINRKNILSLLVSFFHQLELTTGIVKREIKHFHVVVV